MNYTDIFVGIDGTGPYSDGEYKQQFENSFVRILSLKSPEALKNKQRSLGGYIDGPKTFGMVTGQLAEAASTFAAEKYKAQQPSPLVPTARRIFLMGYSRGGAAAIQACHQLKAKAIPVHAVLLFDAVDRSLTIENTIVPSNVTYCAHAMRSPQSGSRSSFGNCGTKSENGVDYSQAYFMTTHGGMGGTLWGAKYEIDGAINERPAKVGAERSFARSLTDAQFRTNVDAATEAMGSNEVWNWMLTKFKAFHAAKPREDFAGISKLFQSNTVSRLTQNPVRPSGTR